jgi:hypothetical protein
MKVIELVHDRSTKPNGAASSSLVTAWFHSALYPAQRSAAEVRRARLRK